MNQNRNDPATKGDLEDAVSGLRTELKGDIASVVEQLSAQMSADKKELMEHFNVVAENIRHDMASANEEEIDVLGDRVTRLEEHTGLVKN
jgi:phage host-nuclease inhibitor protein Gam